MNSRQTYVKYDQNTFNMMIQNMLSNESYQKTQLIKMIIPYLYENENLCRKILELSIGNIIPEPMETGQTVLIDIDKVGWLGTGEKQILADNTKDNAIYGTVLSFNGYHSYTPYVVGFPEGSVNLPIDAVSSIGIVL
jgi:hypothetical protein